MGDNHYPLRQTFGPYTCLSSLGMGTNHTTYYAVNAITGRTVALQVIPITQINPEAVIADAKIQLARFVTLEAPNIVPIEDVGSQGDHLYIANRVMRGGSLLERLRQYLQDPLGWPLPSLGEVAELIRRLAAALDKIHAQGIVHGQIDPRNILLDEAGQVYLADTGLARLTKILYGLDSTNSLNMNDYSAPELWDGQRPSPASDQYSLACIVYELITGQPPFSSTTIYDLMRKHMNDVVLPPHYLRKHLPQDLALVFWQALAKPPEKRFGSVQEFYVDFAEAISGQEGERGTFFTKPLA